MSKTISAKDAIKAVREGKHPSQVFFENDSELGALIAPEKASVIAEMLEDASMIVKESSERLTAAYKESGNKYEAIDNGIQSLSEMMKTLESVTSMVKQSGNFDVNQDPTDDTPDNQRDPKYKENMDNDDNGEEAPLGEPMEQEPSEMPEVDGHTFTVKGVENPDELYQAIGDLVAEHGGVIDMEDVGASYEEDANTIYKTQGKDTKLASGDEPKDEAGTQAGEGDKMIKDIKSSDNKGKGSVQHEAKTRRFKLSEGLRFLLNKRTLSVLKSGLTLKEQVAAKEKELAEAKKKLEESNKVK